MRVACRVVSSCRDHEMQVINFEVKNYKTGVPLPGASVTVYNYGTTTKATIYDIDGFPRSNPMLADENAIVVFGVDTGNYSIVDESDLYVSPTIQKVQFFDGVQAALDIEQLQQSFSSNALAFETWAALSAITGTYVGQPGEVYGDGGTHQDLAAGGYTGATVNNKGKFRWATSPASGWKRIDDNALSLKANQTDLDATNANVTGLTAAATQFQQAYDGVSTKQFIGSPTTPVSATQLSNTTYVFGDAQIAHDGYLTKIVGYALVSGTLYADRWTKSGDNFTRVATYPFTVPSGAFTVSLPYLPIGVIPVAAGEYLGFWAQNGANSFIGRTTTSDVNLRTGIYSGTVGAGHVSSFTDTTIDSGGRVELAFTVEYPTVTEARLAETERLAKLAIEAARAPAEDLGIYSPAFLFAKFGATGAWYDFTDPSSLYSDTAATTNVSVDGDKIGYVRDKSGNGFDLKAASDGVRPTYKTGIINNRSVCRVASGEHLKGTKLTITKNVDKITIFTLVKYSSPSGAWAIVNHSLFASDSSTRVFHGRAADPQFGTMMSITSRQTDAGTAVYAGSAEDTFIYDNYVIQTSITDFIGGKVNHMLNGAAHIGAVNTFPATQNSENLSEAATWIFGKPGGTQSFAGDVLAIVEIVGDVSQELREGVGNYLAWRGSVPIVTLDPFAPFDASAAPRGIMFWVCAQMAIQTSSSPEKYAVGLNSPDGCPVVAEYNFTAGTVISTKLYQHFQIDDHNPASLLKMANNKILAMSTRHGFGSGEIMCRISTNASDATVWDAETDIGPSVNPTAGTDIYRYSYPNLFLMTGESNRVYMFLRMENQGPGPTDVPDWTSEWWGYTYSDNNGLTWAEAKEVWGPNRPYTRIAQNGASRIDFFCNNTHPAHPNIPSIAATNSVYHFYISGGNIYKTNGTLIGPLASTQMNMSTGPFLPTVVYDGTTGSLGRSWVSNAAIDPSTNLPVINFVLFPTTVTDLWGDHRYRQARYVSGAWVHQEICGAGHSLISGQPSYSGETAIDPADVNTVYVSIPVDSSGVLSMTGGTFQIFKFTTTAFGSAAWVGTQLTFGELNSFRPVIPNNGGRRLFYNYGYYGPDFRDWDCEIRSLDIS